MELSRAGVTGCGLALFGVLPKTDLTELSTTNTESSGLLRQVFDFFLLLVVLPVQGEPQLCGTPQFW